MSIHFSDWAALERAAVPREVPGVYLFSRDAKTVAYAGRSDSDLGGRIPTSAREGRGYRYVAWYAATSPRDAYDAECAAFHAFSPPDNAAHPAVPAGTNWRCQQRGCDWGY